MLLRHIIRNGFNKRHHKNRLLWCLDFKDIQGAKWNQMDLVTFANRDVTAHGC